MQRWSQRFCCSVGSLAALVCVCALDVCTVAKAPNEAFHRAEPIPIVKWHMSVQLFRLESFIQQYAITLLSCLFVVLIAHFFVSLNYIALCGCTTAHSVTYWLTSSFFLVEQLLSILCTTFVWTLFSTLFRNMLFNVCIILYMHSVS